jgi:hypothetical protein
MTTLLDIRVLQPGTAEAQEGGESNGSNAESGARRAPQLQPMEVDVVEQPVRSRITEGVSNVDIGSAAHEKIQIGSLLDNRLRMREPLTLVMEQEGEFYIAKCEELNEFGYGTDPIGAVQDMRNTIAELYWELKESQARLGSDLAHTWQVLFSLVYEV